MQRKPGLMQQKLHPHHYKNVRGGNQKTQKTPGESEQPDFRALSLFQEKYEADFTFVQACVMAEAARNGTS